MKALAWAAMSIVLFAGGLAHAQQVTSDQITEQLRPPPLTRSIAQPGGVPKADRELVDDLRGLTRSITVEERTALAPIVANDALPQLDLTIEFEFDSDELTPEASRTLFELGTALSGDTLKNMVFVLAGHTDAKGSEEYNLALSDRRALTVKRFLVRAFQIDPQSLIAVGFGEEQLKNVRDPEAAENRRVAVVNVGGGY